jgi:PAS domain S-box-containing protein
MSEPEHNRLAASARWFCVLALLVVPAVALGAWVASWSLLIGDSVSLALCVVCPAIALFLLGLRAWAVLGALQEALEESTRRQAHLRAIVDTAGDAILTCDGQGLVVSANAAANRLFGYPLAELVGVPLNRLLPEAPLKSVGTDRHKILVTAASAAGRRADGGSFPVSVSISKVRLEGQPLFLIIIHDLSALAEARRQAEESGRAKSAFMLLMSHELRTPLSEVLGMASLLADTELAPEQRRLLATLSQSGEAMLSTVEQLLDFSRLLSGKVSLERRPMSVRQVLFDAAGPQSALARSKGLRFTCVADDDVPPQVLGDPQRLRAVLACLAANAVKFTTSGEVELRVERLPAAEGPCSLAFTVRDTGAGIDAGEQGRVFLPFEQHGRPGGVGLGLSIASRLVSLMGGSITLDSALGRGSTFRLVLPFGLPAEGGGPPPVLVVLADAAERAALEGTLAGLGLPTVGASTGKAALAELLRAVVSGRPFGLVVLEEELAGWDGPAEDWLRQAQGCSDWRGGVVLLRDEASLPEDAGLGRCPAGVTAVMARHEACGRLGDLLGRRAG